MENESKYWSPTQWEDYYLNQLQQDVNKQVSYMNQISQNMLNGFYFDLNAQNNVIAQMRGYKQYLEGYNATADWFIERNLTRFSNFLSAVKLDIDKAINTSLQTYQGTIKSQNSDLAYMRKTQNEINDIYKKMNQDRIDSYNRTNEMWRKIL